MLVISAAVALVSMCLVPPDKKYLGYCNTSVLILLFCLMAVIAGFRSIGFFSHMTAVLLRRVATVRGLGLLLASLCFVASMFVTNDVALILFVPLTILLFERLDNQRDFIWAVVLETVAANLGSMLTPIGNPQNLYLYTYFKLSLWDFLKTLLPLGLAGYALLALASLFMRKEPLPPQTEESLPALSRPRLVCLCALFVICLLTVLRVVPDLLCLGVTCVCILVMNPRLLAKIDYGLLLTFLCFFVFVGNIGRIPQVRELLMRLLAGRELPVTIILSQGISNVPAAVMLSGFTDNVKALLRGVNIGALGTPIASLASLISYRFYLKSRLAQPGKYMAVFLAVNFAMLIILWLLTFLPVF